MAAGLFLDPQAVRIAEDQSRASGDPRAQLQGSLFNLGQAGGGAIRRGFGGDSRSELERRAGALQSLMQRIDMDDPTSIAKGVDVLNKGGFQAEAFKLAELLPTPSTKVTAVGDPFLMSIQDPTNPDNFVIQRHQRMSDGSVKAVGSSLANEVADKDDPNATFLNQALFKKIGVDDHQALNMVERLSSLEEFQSSLPGGGLNDENKAKLKAFIGEIKSTAEQMKRDDLNRLLPAFESGQLSKNQMSLMFDTIADEAYLRRGYKQWIEGGGFNKSIDEGTGGANPQVQGDIDTTDLSTLRANSENVRLKNEAIAAVAAKSGDLVVGDPSTGQFRLNKMSPAQAQNVFSRIKDKSDEDIAQQLITEGFQFTPELYDSHRIRWQFMRENPEAVNTFIWGVPEGNVNGLVSPVDPDLRDAKMTQYMDALQEDLNWPAFASSQQVFKYMNRLAINGEAPTKKGPRYVGKGKRTN